MGLTVQMVLMVSMALMARMRSGIRFVLRGASGIIYKESLIAWYEF